MEKLEVGEKYLSIVVLGSVTLKAFKNKNKQNPKEPDYKGDGVAIWINEKRMPKAEKPFQKASDLP